MRDCSSLDEVRREIDRLDRQLVALLAERAEYVRQAAGFKTDRHDVVVPERIEAIVLKVRHDALEEGTDPDLVEKIFRAMIDAFIIHEVKTWREMHRS